MTSVQERQAPIDPYEPQYTWTFNEKSLLIRSYLWVYEPSNPKSTSFCRLFWSMVCMPLMLPLRLFLIAIHLIAVAGVAVGRGIAWPVKQIPFDRYAEAWSSRQRRLKEARGAEARAFMLAKLRKEEELKAERSAPRPRAPRAGGSRLADLA